MCHAKELPESYNRPTERDHLICQENRVGVQSNGTSGPAFPPPVPCHERPTSLNTLKEDLGKFKQQQKEAPHSAPSVASSTTRGKKKRTEDDVLYKIAIITADKKDAGTDAKTDGIQKEQAWFLQEVEITNVKRKKSWSFVCNNWLSLHHGDQQTTRELFQISHQKQVSPPNSISKIFTRTNFRQNSDTFKIRTNCVGPMKKIKVEHDNTGLGAGWYLERVVITDLNHPNGSTIFPVECGLPEMKVMGLFPDSKYKVTVYTGDKKGAGTDANVILSIFGENGESGEQKLDNSKNNFERNCKDEFFGQVPMPCGELTGYVLDTTTLALDQAGTLTRKEIPSALFIVLKQFKMAENILDIFLSDSDSDEFEGFIEADIEAVERRSIGSDISLSDFEDSSSEEESEEKETTRPGQDSCTNQT
uniref:PLAT domain-containing protein n=1 Tax=Magallana gigas TaxID=29159 RepID=A0A8W8NNL4_MAGGI